MCRKLIVLFVTLFMGLGIQSESFAGSAAPDFSLRNINGKQVSLSDFKGDVVLINFWATWCAPCLTEMPHIQKMYTELKDKGFHVLAISVDAPRDISKIKPLVRRNRFTF